MVVSELVTRMLLHPRILCQPFISEEFVLLHWSKLNCRFSTATVKQEISETMILFTNFSVFSSFSAGSVSSTDSVVGSLIFTASSEVSPLPPPQSSRARSLVASSASSDEGKIKKKTQQLSLHSLISQYFEHSIGSLAAAPSWRPGGSCKLFQKCWD